MEIKVIKQTGDQVMRKENKYRLVSLLLLLLSIASASAQRFEDYFEDRTLRLDYTFAGDETLHQIYVDELVSLPHWYGRRERLAELPLRGNGQITVRSKADGEVIYRHSFSSLFQEWLATDEAKHTQKSFENVFLVPFPKAPVEIKVEIFDYHDEVINWITHTVDPKDILIRKAGERVVTPYVTLQQAADTSHCIHVAYVAEGYQQHEMGTFLEDCKVAMEALFAHEPFKTKQNCFLHLKKLHDVLAGTPYEHIIVLVNGDRYGGGGIYNSYTLTDAHGPNFRPVVVHEFGHSFGGLGDEYPYGDDDPMYFPDTEPWEPNLTTQYHFIGKWENLVKEGKAGLIEGGGYLTKGVWRGFENCRMRTNEEPEFCLVCRQALTRLIDFYTQ